MAKLKFVVRQFAEEGFWNRYRSHIILTIQYKRPVIIFPGKTMMADVLAVSQFYKDVIVHFEKITKTMLNKSVLY